jgi:anti-anti-sigma factor
VDYGPGVREPSARGRRPEAVVLNPCEDTAVLVLLGEHDLANERNLRAQLVALVAEHRLVVLDLSHVEFFDSFCLNTVLSVHNRSLASGHRLVLELGENTHTRRLLEHTGLLNHLTCVTTRAEALSTASLPPAVTSEAAGA